MKFSDEQMGQLKELIDDRLEVKLEEKLEQKLEEKLDQKLDSKLDQKFEEKLGPIRKDLRKVRKDMTFVADVLDNADIELRARVERIERILKISNTS